jgi:hypothetical protein
MDLNARVSVYGELLHRFFFPHVILVCLEEILQITRYHRKFVAAVNKPYPEILRDKSIN